MELVDLGVFFMCEQKGSPSGQDAVGTSFFCKNEKIQFKIDYTVYTKMILNETYSGTIGTLGEWGV